jgi:hypothetical protein
MVIPFGTFHDAFQFELRFALKEPTFYVLQTEGWNFDGNGGFHCRRKLFSDWLTDKSEYSAIDR